MEDIKTNEYMQIINNLSVYIKKLTDTAKLPTRGSAEAAGYDLYADLRDKETL